MVIPYKRPYTSTASDFDHHSQLLKLALLIFHSLIFNEHFTLPSLTPLYRYRTTGLIVLHPPGSTVIAKPMST